MKLTVYGKHKNHAKALKRAKQIIGGGFIQRQGKRWYVFSCRDLEEKSNESFAKNQTTIL